jgi:charged multivesicular body protein 1
MGGQPSKTVDEMVWDMKFQSKALERLSKKSEKEQKKAMAQCKKAITQGNKEGAEIYAQNAIRHKEEALQFLQMAAKVDGVASKLKSVQVQQSVARALGQMSGEMGRAMESMDVMQIAQTMDTFEQQLGELDTQGTLIAGAMDSAQTNTPVDEVDALIQQTADEHGLDMAELMPSTAGLAAPTAAAAVAAEPEPEAVSAADEDALMARLAALA